MLESKWREQIIQWEKFEAHETVFKTKLEAAFDNSYFNTQRDKLLGFTHVCVSEMPGHLCGQCLELTNVEKLARMDDTCVKWDQGDELTLYFLRLNKLQENLLDEDIKWTDKQKLAEAMKELYASNVFEKRDMRQ